MTSKPSVTNCPSALFRLVPVGRHIPAALHCFFFLHANLIQVAIAPGFHLFPFRTEKLSPVTPMVLRNSGQWKSSVTNVSRGTFRLCTARFPASGPFLPRLHSAGSRPLHLSLPPPPGPRFPASPRSAASPLQEVLPHALTEHCVTPSGSAASEPHEVLR